MKKNELRIGNFVHYQINDEFDERKQWNEIIKIEAMDFECFDKYYTPIELTADWLLKFGFRVRENLFTLSHYWVEFRTFNNGKEVIFFGCYQHTKIFIMETTHYLKYVHQLQNLYFALTGKELKECDI